MRRVMHTAPDDNKAPNYPVRIIPEVNPNGMASGYLPDTAVNIILGGVGGPKP